MDERRISTRLYVPGALAAGRAVALPAAQAHHALAVLRLKAGDAVALFNGDGAQYEGVIERAVRREVVVRVERRDAAGSESRLEIVLGQGLAAGERMDYTVQKSVELGIAAIEPVAAQRSVVRLDAQRAAKRAAHWQSVAVAACEQCGRNRVPPVAPVATLAAWLARRGGRDGAALRLLLSPRGDTRLRELPPPAGAVAVLAGPEGGFTADEERLAQAHGFVRLRLGPRVLRTETAAVAALAGMQALWGDF